MLEPVKPPEKVRREFSLPRLDSSPLELVDLRTPWQPLASAYTQTDEPWEPLAHEPPQRPLGKLWESRRLGGSLTVFVLLQGESPLAHQRTLKSLLKTTSRARCRLHVFALGVDQATLDCLSALKLTALEVFEREYTRAQAMIRAFYDEKITPPAPYIAWLESPAYIAHPGWLDKLAAEILRQKPETALYGAQRRREVTPAEAAWLKQGWWHQGKPLRDYRGRPHAAGDSVFYCQGHFWAGRLDALRTAGAPDRRALALSSDWVDVVMGEQLYQHGFRTKPINLAQELAHLPLADLAARTPSDLLPQANPAAALPPEVQGAGRFPAGDHRLRRHRRA